MMEFTDISIESEWARLVESYQEANFLQSFGWGEFETRLEKTIVRRALIEDGMTKAVWQGVVEKAKRGTYLAVAGGPLLNWQDFQVVELVFQDMKQVATRQKCSFVRFRPQALESAELKNIVSKWGAVPSPMHVTADLTLELDLNMTDDELLSQMRKNHRYMIRKADRDGITTTISQNPAEIQEFFDLQIQLAQKHGFVPFSFNFLETQFKTFVERDQAFLVHAKLDQQLLATAFIIVYNQQAVYHYGVSSEQNSNLPGSYAAQWRAILEAKMRGCKIYNFWGISPIDAKEHRFAGVSLFKRGFGGEEVQYLPAHDLPLHSFYWFTFLFELFRKKLRKL